MTTKRLTHQAALSVLTVILTLPMFAETNTHHPAIPTTSDGDRAAPSIAEQQEALDRLAKETLPLLFDQTPAAKKAFEESTAYGVFDGVKAGVLVSGTGGTGVVVDRTTDKRTYMSMGGAGVGLGGGLQSYRLIVLFQTQDAYQRFVDGRWDASVSAQAAAGKDGRNATSSFVDGIATYQLTDKGLIAQVDISGTKFWLRDELNAAGHAAVN